MVITLRKAQCDTDKPLLVITLRQAQCDKGIRSLA